MIQDVVNLYRTFLVCSMGLVHDSGVKICSARLTLESDFGLQVKLKRIKHTAPGPCSFQTRSTTTTPPATTTAISLVPLTTDCGAQGPSKAMPSDEDEAMPVAQETERADRNHDRQHMTAPGQTPEGQHPTTQPIHVAPVQTVPRRDYVHVEYPGVVSTHPQPSGDTVHRSNLDTALATLSPHPPPYSTVFSALDHLGCIVSLKSKVIECRPWIADYYSDDQAQASTSTLAGPKTGAEMDLFRHALTGHLVETNNFVAVVQRRVWRRVRRTKGTRVQQSSPAVSGDRNTRSAQSRGSSPSQVVSKEYTVEPLGVARHTARWRTMADFVYEPNLGNASSRSPDKRGDGEKIVSVPTSLVEAQGDASEDVAGTTQTADVDMDTVGLNEASQRQTSPTTDLASRDEVDSSDVDGKNQSVPESQVRTPNEQSEPSKRPPTGGLMTLYDALVRMDVDSLCSFAMPGEKEDYEIEETGTEPPQKKSNARMVPPPAFTRVELPFPYAFRQAPLSGVETWQRILPDGNKQEVKRWVNHSRWQNISPTQWFLHFDTPVPTGPQSHIAKMAERCDKRLLNKLRRLFEDRPVWTRAALLNQLDTTEDRRTVTFSKEYLPLVSYAIPEGVYSTTYVRFGFDVRSDSACRQ